MKTSKGFGQIVLITIISVLLAVAVYMALKPKSTVVPEENQETEQNQDGQQAQNQEIDDSQQQSNTKTLAGNFYTLEYPDNWTTEGHRGLYGSGTLLYSPEVEETYIVSVAEIEDLNHIGGAPEYKSPEEWYQESIKSFTSHPAAQGQSKGVGEIKIINGYTAYYVTQETSYTDHHYLVVNRNNTKGILFTYREKESRVSGNYNYSDYRDEFEDIVNSIKFSN